MYDIHMLYIFSPLRRRIGAMVQNPEVNDDKLNGFLAHTKIERNMFCNILFVAEIKMS